MAKRDIIVIGASAGGIEPLQKLFERLPLLEVSIFVVLHQHAERKSFLTEILAKKSVFNIQIAKNNLRVKKKHVYIAPSDHHLIIEKNIITLSKGPRINFSRPSIDILFTSAANSYGSKVIGILLSGLLDDGTSGLNDIKSQGGLCIVQDPKEAIHNDMPLNALENVTIDYCLPVEKIAKKLSILTKKSAKKTTKNNSSSKKILQTEIASQKITQTKEDVLNKVGKVSPFTCPECQGSLWEIHSKDILRYRCRIGHAYNIKNLNKAKDISLENTLWAGIRALEENASLAYKIANMLKKNNHRNAAGMYMDKGKKADVQAIELRKILLYNIQEDNPREE
jgi:two-component system chemotaxis response regulator CheB